MAERFLYMLVIFSANRAVASKDLASATSCTDVNFLSFLRRCLRWDPKVPLTYDSYTLVCAASYTRYPKVRMTPEKAMEHPWITEAEGKLTPSDSDSDGEVI
jgi:hypothetical protein